jgi:hypothetical protein
MPTFTYSPTESVTIAPTGDLTIVDGATSTTFSKANGTKTVTKTPPDPNPSAPENAFTNQTKGNGDVVQKYTDLTTTPPVTVKLTFHPSGNVDVTVAVGDEQTRTLINAATGARQRHTWKVGNPEPNSWVSDTPTSTRGGAPGGGSSGGKKKKKPAKRSKPAKKKKSPAKKKKKAKKRR